MTCAPAFNNTCNYEKLILNNYGNDWFVGIIGLLG